MHLYVNPCNYRVSQKKNFASNCILQSPRNLALSFRFLWITHVCWKLTRLSSLMARQSWISGRVKKCSLKQFFLWTPCKSFPTLAPPYLAKSSSKFLNHMVDEKKILQDSTWQNLWKTVVMSSSNLCVSQTLQRYTYSKVLRLVFSSYPPPTYHGRD